MASRCPECGKEFLYPSGLARHFPSHQHQQTHASPLRPNCPYCTDGGATCIYEARDGIAVSRICVRCQKISKIVRVRRVLPPAPPGSSGDLAGMGAHEPQAGVTPQAGPGLHLSKGT